MADLSLNVADPFDLLLLNNLCERKTISS